MRHVRFGNRIKTKGRQARPASASIKAQPAKAMQTQTRFIARCGPRERKRANSHRRKAQALVRKRPMPNRKKHKAGLREVVVTRTLMHPQLESVWLRYSGGTVYLIFPEGHAQP